MPKRPMVEQLIRRIKADPGDEAAFLGLGVALAAGGNLAGLNECLTYRNASGGSGTALAFDICSHLTRGGQPDTVLELCRGFGDDNPFSAALHAAAAFVHFLRFENDRGVVLLREGVRRLLLLAEQHPGETLSPPYLTKLVAAAFLFEPLDWPSGPGDAPGPLTLIHPGDWNGREAVCAAFGDALYFRAYGERLAGGFHEHAAAETALLIGLVNPDEAALALAAELVRRHPALTIAAVRHNGDRLPEYCCSARFLFAGTLLEMVRRPLILTDIDSGFGPGSGEVLRMVRAFPLAHIQVPEIWPQLTIDASVVGAHPGPGADAFFQRVSAYVRAKLAETGPLWTHDQVALHRAISALRRDGSDIANVNTVLPARLHLPGFFKTGHALPLAEREKTRSNDRVALIGLGDGLKPLFRES